MKPNHQPVYSFVVPLYNESSGLQQFHDALAAVADKHFKDSYEIVYCNDGSTDTTLDKAARLAQQHPAVRLISLTRNFGKEIALTAGVAEARGQAIITLDADGQHPVELIPEFIEHWKAGAKVVVGIRTSNQKEGWLKRHGSKVFYWLFNRFTGKKLLAGASDFRLIDHVVQRDFVQMTERNRITRGMVDWLGYPQEYIYYKAHARMAGEAGYSLSKLIKLAIDTVVSMSISPLHIMAYIGAAVLPISVLLGFLMTINAVVGDPFGLDITGGAFVLVLILMLIGILLVSQGIIGMYLAHIHAETQNRPLYIIDAEKSRKLHES
jgi:dolichol-phosphate mannosyltransferase